ncbi:adenine deaminase C-terminal domain-containing protein [Roseomonas sp. E05]|uniref:adenine deaminase n=1 Tax=Roseomonas sp. E05 TaxID=3046310 RepID=UPI0024BBBDFA|nr:adenine deaminase C-terminal domain-containing protein [Roseomonas sp. E05]MDJ0388088.1 adenine deaminase C-terminal domain-containing protein [Roseomonas sp. E05]
MTQADLHDPALRDRAVRAARGEAPFDLLLTGGQVADMATGELRAADIGLVGPLIASVHAPGTHSDAAARRPVPGRIIAPGLIDTHMHVESSMVTPRRYAETVLPQGTTTICWDPHELGNVAGLDGLRWAIDALRGLPLRALVLAPSCVPSAPGLERAGADFGPAELAEMLSWPEIAGVAEVMDMRGVLERSPRMAGIVGAGLASGKLVCGHARSLTGPGLQGFAAAGIESDHEITSGADLLEKLRAGFTVELRGSHDYILPEAVAALNALPRYPQTLTLCTDDVFPDDLVAKGGMIDLLRRLARHGMPPLEALRAATLNAAMRLGRRDLGLVAPGRRADLVVLDGLESLGVEQVFASGALVAEGGRLAAALPPADPPGLRGTMKLAPLAPADFHLAASGDMARLRSVVNPRFTQWGELTVPVREGRAVLPPEATLLAVIHRHGLAPARPVLGVLEGWGAWRGALATTVAHDSHNLCVFGHDPADMAAAANALIACGGGMAVAAGGAVRAVLPLPVCGLLSDAPAEQVAAQFTALRAAADEIAEWQPPYRVFKAVVGATLACNAGPHVTDLGIADGGSGAVFPGALVEG